MLSPASCHQVGEARGAALPPQEQPRLTGQFASAADQAVQDQGPPDVPVLA